MLGEPWLWHLHLILRVDMVGQVEILRVAEEGEGGFFKAAIEGFFKTAMEWFFKFTMEWFFKAAMEWFLNAFME